VLVACLTLTAVCQQKLSNTEIANIINMSKQANQANGIFNPDKIAVGQKLTFLFANGEEKTVTAEKGDFQWKILQNKIAKLIVQNGNVVSYPTDPIAQTPQVNQTPTLIDPVYISNNDFSAV